MKPGAYDIYWGHWACANRNCRLKKLMTKNKNKQTNKKKTTTKNVFAPWQIARKKS